MKVRTILFLTLILIIAYELTDWEFLYVHSQPNTTISKKPSHRPVIYFVPHADDEVLTYSPDMQNEMQQGRPIYLILFSKGEESIAREVLNGTYDRQSFQKDQIGQPVFCKWHWRVHSPTKEHFADGTLSHEEFGNARVKDFYRVAKALGIHRSHVQTYAIPNGHFAPSQVKALIKKYISKFPDADFRTMSSYDIHPDHAAMGKALEHLIRTKKIPANQVRFFLSIYTDRLSGKTIPKMRYYSQVKKNSIAYNRIQKSIDFYAKYDPKHGFYATGYHSVPAQFNALKNALYSTWYQPH
ncbi:GlcNAc-PI de-N-acetylase [Marininema mesophilum]|uniref:GlcNAc-PI de-N-acetylase n=1 Tax=Marininema mesophilum TaxID=1048340 RepID=A0A1H2RX96_9BACL|nr:PIG-L family deacetylase [Marininema mesophilum]SDW23394.1 GlcNAc-PI de-N-acetylase [Marininema mesophilum]